jgi:hypothetical protein
MYRGGNEHDPAGVVGTQHNMPKLAQFLDNVAVEVLLAATLRDGRSVPEQPRGPTAWVAAWDWTFSGN